MIPRPIVSLALAALSLLGVLGRRYWSGRRAAAAGAGPDGGASN